MINDISRRTILRNAALLLASASSANAQVKLPMSNNQLSPEEWMTSWLVTKGLGKPLRIGRFKDRTYFLLREVWWEPKPSSQAASLKRVTAPTGFVTDFASIPREFWSFLAPDEDYAYAAVIHDYLYWDQRLPRETADQILKLAMEELEVPRLTVAAIYTAVRGYGKGPWAENEKLKKAGEKRVLKRVPEDAKTTWSEWKKQPGTF